MLVVLHIIALSLYRVIKQLKIMIMTVLMIIGSIFLGIMFLRNFGGGIYHLFNNDTFKNNWVKVFNFIEMSVTSIVGGYLIYYYFTH